MLIAKFASSPFRIVDYETIEAPQADDLANFSAPFSTTLTGELDGAQRSLGVAAEEILLAALGRAIARTIGEGVVAVDVAGRQCGPSRCACTSAGFATATEMLGAVHRDAGRTTACAEAHSEAAVRHLLLVPRRRSPGRRHALELRVYRADDVVRLDWWYDTRSFDRYTVEELAEQFPLALIELTSEADPAGVTPRWPSATEPLESAHRR